MKHIINECIIVRKKLGDTVVMAKNRDRMYKPELEVVHEIINGVEVVYLHDVLTDWSEGINEFGVGILNTALMVGYDEKEKQLVKKTGKKSKDGIKIREALGQKSMGDSLKVASKFMGGIKGHTFISTENKFISIETTSKHNPKFTIHDKDNTAVRTNHGHDHWDAGYTQGPDYLSSKVRKSTAEKVAAKVDEPNDILSNLRKDLFKQDSNLNMTRKTEKMFTSSQVMLNLSDLIFELNYFTDKVDKFHGVKTNLPKGYEPKIKIEIKKI